MKKDTIKALCKEILKTGIIDNELYVKYDVKRGLRDLNGKGVLAGLTEISEVNGTIMKNGNIYPREGELRYRGIEINELIEGFIADDRFGFEEVIYLLLFGYLPNPAQLDLIKEIISEYRTLPEGFVRDIIMKNPSKDIMNALSRSVLALYSFDNNPDDTSLENVLRQSLFLISNFALLAIYSYAAISYYFKNKSLIIHKPVDELSIAENFLHMLRQDNKYSKLEVVLLDIALVLHAEHGGGNNSTFTNHVVTSSGTDTYSAVSSSLCSLKGPRHGGANIKVSGMMEDIKKNVKDWTNEDEISAYLEKILLKQAFDEQGLIYGIGHAVYSLSDPRALILKKYAKILSDDKGLGEEFDLYSKVEKLAPEVISQKREIFKGVSANVDFYSGFVYKMLGIPEELFTPLFAVSRIAGWSAHRLEEIVNKGRIIRPAYRCVLEQKEYVKLNNR